MDNQNRPCFASITVRSTPTEDTPLSPLVMPEGQLGFYDYLQGQGAESLTAQLKALAILIYPEQSRATSDVHGDSHLEVPCW
ncbi:hypothetical protein MJO28_014275 [Puccinia striiformis f. sp. tritici]|uniref:Uncharacterized protein n=1 Tax=Puccinia striiformis f. sp. tritici TaxID=168172 RepID=A0ACC0DUB4_9BASI|nr:hypothetical protein MJO28_014275 [Puccinia striiformis f. sp. tritici]